jgi:hypothetical protein
MMELEGYGQIKMKHPSSVLAPKEKRIIENAAIHANHAV